MSLRKWMTGRVEMRDSSSFSDEEIVRGKKERSTNIVEKKRKKKKLSLVKFSALPDYLKDNEYIMDYYRCEWPLKDIFLSFFSLHNESLNIWTHFVGFLIFATITMASFMDSAMFHNLLLYFFRPSFASPLTTLLLKKSNDSCAFSVAESESPVMSSYPEWRSHMQAYYGSGISSPHLYAPVVQSQHARFSWSQPPLIAPFGTPVPYPSAYSAAGIYTHHNMTLTPNTPRNAGVEGKLPNAKDFSAKKSAETNVKARESTKATSGSGNDGASHSVESGSDGSLDASDENTDQQGFAANKKGSFHQMLADGASGQNNAVGNISSVRGDPVVSMPVTNLNMGIDIWGSFSTAGGAQMRPKSGVSLGPDPTNERELRREKRKQSNRESARRSRLRKQQECEELQRKVDALGDENSTLRQELQMLSEECQKLTNENKSIKDELTRIYGPEAVVSDP